MSFVWLIGNICCLFCENGLLIIPILFVINAQTHTDWYILWRCQMAVRAFRITGQPSVCSTVWYDWQQINIKDPRYCPFVRGLQWWLMNSCHKGTIMRNMFPFDDAIMESISLSINYWFNLYKHIYLHEYSLSWLEWVELETINYNFLLAFNYDFTFYLAHYNINFVSIYSY